MDFNLYSEKQDKKEPWYMLVWDKIQDIYYTIVPFSWREVNIDKEILYFFQRGKRGWSDKDAWRGCSHIARIIKGVCSDTISNASSCPTDCIVDDPNSIQEVNDKLSMEKWHGILEEIRWSFDMAEKVSNQDVESYIPEWDEQKNIDWKNKLAEIAKEHGVEPYVCMTKQEYERMMAGFDLFKQYFFSLWD